MTAGITWDITQPDTTRRVTFTAACPSCDRPCPWISFREDTRLRSDVRCACGGAA